MSMNLSVRKGLTPEINYLPEGDTYTTRCYTVTPVIIRLKQARPLIENSDRDSIDASLTKNLCDKYAALRGTQPVNPKFSVEFRNCEDSQSDNEGQTWPYGQYAGTCRRDYSQGRF